MDSQSQATSSPATSSPTTPSPAPGRFARFRRWVRRGVRAFVFLFLTYVALILIGLIPVNRAFENADEGIEIFVFSDYFHSEILLPVKTDRIDWSSVFKQEFFAADISKCTYISFGWGDRKFFTETPTWDDFNLWTATRAFFWPTDPALHASYYFSPRPDSNTKKVVLQAGQYSELVDFVERFIARSESNGVVHLDGTGYSKMDTFFQAHGNYHFLNTCNTWAGRALKQAGVRVPLFTPLPRTPLFYLPAEK